MSKQQASVDVLEGNEAIAIFLKLETDYNENKSGGQWEYLVDGYWLPVRKLKYHSSWDWLMPVVEKIEKDCFKVLISTFGLSDWHYTEIRKGTKHYGYGKSEMKIKSTWLAVIDFITWYNTQNNQS